MDAKEHPPHALGRWGEDRAVRYLQRRGWVVLARNFRFGRREVDLVVRRGRVVAFVEVKTRSGDGFGAPEEAITPRKRREVEAVAAYYLRAHGMADALVRFDAVAIVVHRGGDRTEVRLEHIEDAWRPGWS